MTRKMRLHENYGSVLHAAEADERVCLKHLGYLWHAIHDADLQRHQPPKEDLKC